MRLLQQSCGEAGDDDDEESSSVWRDLGGRVTMTSPNVSLFLEMGEITIGGVPQNVSLAENKLQCWFLNGFLVFTVGTLLWSKCTENTRTSMYVC